ncbi:hypothetical protein [Pedobacter duraquae]|uniref:Uncharacterized protein n=1 Tax=Pedobacter duraquae TaxID=425511 RepID=A0A4R6ISF9_9SPHI|nr:hypothetical protein [Pedobacter duraquae]TDO24906.1 hypothetical protein CLV32_1201 [Pedobacter duraquae]
MKLNTSFFLTAFCAVSLALVMQSCSQEPDFKVVRQEVLDQHDQLMLDGEKVMTLQMKLDTLSKSGLKTLKVNQPALDTVAEQQQIKALLNDLVKADDSMNNWMHAFNPDAEGKSNHDAVLYFKDEKVKVNQIDSLYRIALTNANTYLKRLNMATDTTVAVHQHKM